MYEPIQDDSLDELWREIMQPQLPFPESQAERLFRQLDEQA